MKKLLFLMTMLALFAGCAKQEEMAGRPIGTHKVTTQVISLTPIAEPSTGVEGEVYYDSSVDNLKYRNASAWQTVAASTASTLDEAYNSGAAIDVDGDAVTLTTSDTDNNVVLAVVQNEATNDNSAMTITMGTGATGTGLLINSVTSGTDIAGDNWSVTQTGEIITAGDVLLNGTYDAAWDVSRQQLILEDNAKLGIGGEHDAAADMTISGDGTDVKVEVATQDGADLIFGATNALDIIIYNDAADSTITFDNSAEDLQFNGIDITLQDADILNFGDSDDITIAFDGAVGNDLDILGSGLEIAFGANDEGIDVIFHGETASANVMWDESANQFVGAGGAQISLNDDVELLFGTGTTNAGDFAVYGSGTGPKLLVDVVTAGQGSIEIGNDADDVPLKWFAENTGCYFQCTAQDVVVEGMSLCLGDGDALEFGDDIGTGDFSIVDTSDVLVINNIADGTGTVGFGAAGAGIDVAFHGDAGSATMTWDENQNTNGALVFNNADVEIGDGDLINFGDTDDFSMTATDTTFTWQGLQTNESETINIGADQDGIDLTVYGATASATSKFDASIDMWGFTNIDVKLDDAAVLFFGTGTNMTTADGDVGVNFTDGTPGVLRWTMVADDQFVIGSGSARADFVVDNATTAGADFWFDASADTNAGTVYLGADNKGIDFVLYGETASKKLWWDMSGDELFVGADDEEVDVTFYGGEASDYMKWDGDLNTYGALVFEDSTIQMQDDTVITFGDGRDISMQYDEDGDDDLQIKGRVSLETTYCQFDHEPVVTAWASNAAARLWGGAATGATGDENLMMFQNASFVYHILGAGQTELGPQLRVGGFDISMDEGDNEGVEIAGAQPLVGGGKDNFTVGTDAFYLKVKIYMTDISGTDDLWVGFRKVEAFQAAVNDYDTYAMIGLQATAGDFYTSTELNGAAGAETDVTDAGGDWEDLEAHTLEVYVAANKAVTYKIDGDEPTGVAAFEWTDADVVVPFVYFLHNVGDGAELTYLQSWECGLQ